MDTVRFGVVGLGNMGRFHADLEATVPRGRPVEEVAEQSIAPVALVRHDYVVLRRDPVEQRQDAVVEDVQEVAHRRVVLASAVRRVRRVEVGEYALRPGEAQEVHGHRRGPIIAT